MKKKIFIGVIIALLMCTLSVYASEISLQVSGDNTVKAGETKKLTVKILADEAVGVFSGKIEGNASIETIQLEGKNGWNLIVYENSNFKLIKAIGGNNEDSVEVTYKVKDSATENPKITISNISLTTIEYDIKSLSNIEKEITIQKEEPKTLTGITITKAPNKTSYKVGEKFDKTGMEVTANYSDNSKNVITNYTYSPDGALSENDKNITITYTESGVTKTVTQAITIAKDQTNNGGNNNNNNNSNPTNPSNNGNSGNNNSNNSNNSNNNNSKQKTTQVIKANQVDTTVAKKQLAKAGDSLGLIAGILAMTFIAIISYIKYKRII